MNKTRVGKKIDVDDDTNVVKIMFTLIHTEEPITLSAISKQTEIPANLVFYHLKNLIKDSIVLETEEKTYYCQPILNDNEENEDLEALMMVMIRMLIREIKIDNPTERKLGKAVLNNLKMYMQLFELEVET